MHVSLLLADSAQVSEGKVHALGLGWTTTQLPTPPMSVVLLLDADWSSTATDIDVLLELVDADGRAVEVPGPHGGTPLSAQLTAHCGHSARPAGSPTRVPIVVNFPPGLPLSPGQRYQWRVLARAGGVAGADQTFFVADR